MLEWMIVLGAVCGAVAVFGLLVIVLNCLWLLRAATMLERLLPRARARIRYRKERRARCAMAE